MFRVKRQLLLRPTAQKKKNHIQAPPPLALPSVFSGKRLQNPRQNFKVMKKQRLKEREERPVPAEPQLDFGEQEE